MTSDGGAAAADGGFVPSAEVGEWVRRSWCLLAYPGRVRGCGHGQRRRSESVAGLVLVVTGPPGGPAHGPAHLPGPRSAAGSSRSDSIASPGPESVTCSLATLGASRPTARPGSSSGG